MTKPKLLMTRVVSPAVIERARRDYDLDLNKDDHIMSADELVARCQGKDAALVTLTEKFTPEVIGRLPPSLRVIATYSVGFEHIDLAAAKARGIRVANTPDGHHHRHRRNRDAAHPRRGPARAGGRTASKGQEMGRVAAHAAHRAQARRQAARRHGAGQDRTGRRQARPRLRHGNSHYNRRRAAPAEEQGAIYHDTLDSLLAVSDVLSISAPSTPETRGSINATALAKLPRGAIVVNTARGDLVNDDDLIAAFKSGQVGYAGLDVYKGEPNIHPGYYELENVFLLPHMGTSVIEARNEMGFAALDNIDAALAGREPPSALV